MASKNSILDVVLKRFPESEQLIEELFAESDCFRSICENYADCIEVLNRYESCNRMTRKGYIKEYRELLKELEKELLSKLNNR